MCFIAQIERNRQPVGCRDIGVIGDVPAQTAIDGVIAAIAAEKIVSLVTDEGISPRAAIDIFEVSNRIGRRNISGKDGRAGIAAFQRYRYRGRR